MYGEADKPDIPSGAPSPWHLARTWLSPAALGVLLFIVYLATLAPGLTWANDGVDGGDLITAAAVGGVPHPSGYPTYLLLARLFQLLPLGSLAYRTNLMSAVASACAAALLYDFARCVARAVEMRPNRVGWISGLAYGLAPLVWSQAVITEVYALQGLFIVTALWWLARLRRGRYTDLFFGLLLGLLLGIHLTALWLIPAFLMMGALPARRRPFITLLRRFSGLGLGLLVYLILPLRAAHHPPVNWGDVETVDRFWWQISGQLYHDYLASWPDPAFWLRLRFVATLLLYQAGFFGLMLAALGLTWPLQTRWLFLTIWMFVTNTAFVLLYNTTDAYIYLIPALISFSIWIGWGSARLFELFSRRQPIGGALGILILLYLLGLTLWHWPQVDASRDARAEHFARQALAALPRDAIVLASGDGAVFALWYEVFALQQRADLIVLAEDLLPFDWYRQSSRATYPEVVIPEAADSVWAVALWQENSSRPFCYVRSEDGMTMACRP